MGLLFLCYSFQPAVEAKYPKYFTAFQIGVVVPIVVALCRMVRPPAWAKPAWVRWVERHPKRMYTAMAEMVRAGEAWGKHTEIQKAVDAWVRALKRRSPGARRGKWACRPQPHSAPSSSSAISTAL